MKYTHILVMYRGQKSSMLFRAENGMLVGMQQNAVVVMGDTPHHKTSHTFIDVEHAMRFLAQTYPAMDLKAQEREELPMIEERDGESHGLYLPEDSLEMPGFGPGGVKGFSKN